MQALGQTENKILRQSPSLGIEKVARLVVVDILKFYLRVPAQDKGKCDIVKVWCQGMVSCGVAS